MERSYSGRAAGFRTHALMMATTVVPGPTFTFGTPESLFSRAGYELGLLRAARGYAVSLDGEQLLMLKRVAWRSSRIAKCALARAHRTPNNGLARGLTTYEIE